MKRQRRIVKPTGQQVRIVLQVSTNRNGEYKGLYLGSIHPVVSNSLGNKKYGVWIRGVLNHKKPVFLYSHEYKYVLTKIKRKRIKKIKRRRLK